METQVTVIGVTGTVGSRVAAKLAQRGIQVCGALHGFCRTCFLPRITWHKGCSACPGRPNGVLAG